MTFIHRTSNGSGREMRTISLNVALAAQGITITIALAVIGFLLGGENVESRIDRRMSIAESDNRIQDKMISDLIALFDTHASQQRAEVEQLYGEIERLDIGVVSIEREVALLRQRLQIVQKRWESGSIFREED